MLISLDGTPPGVAHREGGPAFERLARRGLEAERLVPVFPTNTFPNHVTLVTGVAPERHGIVSNVFVDPKRGLFHYSSDPSWIEVEPLWSLAARAGIVSASFHWVGSEGAWPGGFGPRHWKRFDGSVPESRKVEQILAWLGTSEPHERPRLITAWFHGADAVAHREGPDSPAVARTLRAQGAALERLVRGLAALGLLESTTLLVVSDHGMIGVEHAVPLQAALSRAGVRGRVLGGGGFAILQLDASPTGLEPALAAARGRGLEAYARGATPPELRVGNPRFGDAVFLAPPGTAIVGGRGRRGAVGSWLAALWARVGGELPLRGAHGYRPRTPGMGALFLAVGRGAHPGARIGPVRAVDVAPTVLTLLGAPVPDWMEGRPIEALTSHLESPAPRLSEEAR